jgi:hypothetical protein
MSTTTVARLDAQIRELQVKAIQAQQTGDQPRYRRLHEAWVRIMKLRLGR